MARSKRKPAKKNADGLTQNGQAAIDMMFTKIANRELGELFTVARIQAQAGDLQASGKPKSITNQMLSWAMSMQLNEEGELIREGNPQNKNIKAMV